MWCSRLEGGRSDVATGWREGGREGGLILQQAGRRGEVWCSRLEGGRSDVATGWREGGRSNIATGWREGGREV